MILLLVAILLVHLAGFICARLEARRLVHASLARTPAEFEALEGRPSPTSPVQ